MSTLSEPSTSMFNLPSFDIQKAFDTVPHDKLLIKQWNAGITGTLGKFLSDRVQCVKVDGYLSG